MPDLSATFSNLDKRYGLPTAGFAVASFAAFIVPLKGGFHLTNNTLMVSGMLFFIACALYYWHNRDQSSVSYVDEKESFAERLWQVPWRSLFASLGCLCVAALFGYLAWTGGLLPGN
jgi:hypothetical protein